MKKIFEFIVGLFKSNELIVGDGYEKALGRIVAPPMNEGVKLMFKCINKEYRSRHRVMSCKFFRLNNADDYVALASHLELIAKPFFYSTGVVIEGLDEYEIEKARMFFKLDEKESFAGWRKARMNGMTNTRSRDKLGILRLMSDDGQVLTIITEFFNDFPQETLTMVQRPRGE